MSAALESLLPHRAPMRWLDALIECTETTAIGTVRVTAEHFAVVDGLMLESALVECAAQTVAAALGQRRRTGGHSGPAQTGMLAAVSNFQITARPAIGDTLTIEVREVKRLGPMLMVAVRLSVVGQAPPPDSGSGLARWGETPSSQPSRAQRGEQSEHHPSENALGARAGSAGIQGSTKSRPTTLIATGELTLYA